MYLGAYLVPECFSSGNWDRCLRRKEKGLELYSLPGKRFCISEIQSAYTDFASKENNRLRPLAFSVMRAM